MNFTQGHAYLKDLSPTTQKQPPKEPLSPKTSPYLPNYYCSPSKWVRIEPDGTEKSPSDEKSKGLYQTPPRYDRPNSERPVGPRKSDIVRPSSYRTSPYRPRFRSCNDKAKLNNNFRNFIQDRLQKLRERDLSGELKSAVDILTKRHEERWLNDVSREEQPSLMSTLNMARNNGSLSTSEPTLPTKFSPFVSPKRTANPNIEPPKSLAPLVETSSPPAQKLKPDLTDEEKAVAARLEMCRQIGLRNFREMSVETTESGENVQVFSDATHTDPDTSFTDSKEDSFEISEDKIKESSMNSSNIEENEKRDQITAENRLESLQKIKSELQELNEIETDLTYPEDEPKSKLIVEDVKFNESDSKTSVVLSVSKPSVPSTIKMGSSRTWLDDKLSVASSDGLNDISGYPEADPKNCINNAEVQQPEALVSESEIEVEIENEIKNQSEMNRKSSNDDSEDIERGNQIDDLIGPSLIIQEKRSSLELTREFAQQNDLSNLDLAEIEADAHSRSSSDFPLSESESEFTSISSHAMNIGKHVDNVNKSDDTPSSLSIDEDILNEMQPIPAFDECHEDESRDDLNEWSQTENQTIERISPVYEMDEPNQGDSVEIKSLPGSYSPVPLLLTDAELPKSSPVKIEITDGDTKNEDFSITHDYSFQLTNSDKPSQYPLVQDFSFTTNISSPLTETNPAPDAENSTNVQLQKSSEKYQLINDYSFSRYSEDKKAEHPLVHDYSFHSTQVGPSFNELKATNSDTEETVPAFDAVVSMVADHGRVTSESEKHLDDVITEFESESEEKYLTSVGSVAETVVNNSIAGAIVSQCITSAQEILQTEAHIDP